MALHLWVTLFSLYLYSILILPGSYIINFLEDKAKKASLQIKKRAHNVKVYMQVIQ